MCGCESWTVRKAKCQKIDAFELWCWRRLLRVPWTAWRSNQSILKEISPEYSLEGLILKLKLQYFGHLMLKTNSLEKTLMLEKIEGRSRRRWLKMRWFRCHHWLYGHEFEQAPGVGDGHGGLAYCSPQSGKESDMTDQLNWRIWGSQRSQIHRHKKQSSCQEMAKMKLVLVRSYSVVREKKNANTFNTMPCTTKWSEAHLILNTIELFIWDSAIGNQNNWFDLYHLF